MTTKRCICRRSDKYPICDGSHAADWCSVDVPDSIDRLILTSRVLQSFGEWFAVTHDLLPVHRLPSHHNLLAKDIWVVYDGTDLELLVNTLLQIPHHEEHWIHVGDAPHISASLMHVPVRERHHYHLVDIDISSFTMDLLQPLPMGHIPYTNIFISHSVQDESLLLPLLDRLHHTFGVSFFLCANMSNGVDWYRTIEHQIHVCEAVWVFCSEGLRQSTFCAFEIGLAQGFHKPIIPIQLDDTTPPLFLQHQNMSSIPRTMLQKPWLSSGQALETICTTLLYTPH